MKRIIALAITAALFAACSLFTIGNAPVKNATAHAEMRAAVALAKDAWMSAAQACVDVAHANNDEMPPVCRTALVPAHGLIVAAAKAVDASNDAPKAAACELADAVHEIASVLPTLGPAGKEIAPIVNDAVILAEGLGSCAVDAGAE
jgi:hypothetical protein